ncbi:TPA: hypothetical protein ACH3X2_002495 [Trebouxia sp. C0005]
MISGSKAQKSKKSVYACDACYEPVWGPCDDNERYGGYMPGRQYFRDSCVASPAPLHQQEYFNSFMASLIGETACGDHFRKPSNLVHVRAGRFSAGYYSIMNKMCQIIGQWVVFSKTLSELGTPLKDLHDRLVRLQGKGIQHFWADDPPVCASYLHEIWADVQTVKDDLFHWLDRINRTIPAGHRLKRLFAAAMARAVCLEVNVADLRLLRAALEEEERYTKEQVEAVLNTGKVRRYIPSPVLLAERLIKVMEEFSNLRIPEIKCQSCSHMAYLFGETKKDLLPPDQMFYAGPIGKNQIRWIAVHGSSKLEGYHRWMNAQLSSGTTSPELAGALMCRHKWAVDLVEEKSRLYQQLQMPNPYSDFKVLGPTKEKFGYDWDPSTVHAVLQVEDAQAAAPGPVEGQDQIFELMQGGSEDPWKEGPTMAAAKAIMADPAKREAVQAQIAQVKETWREISGASLPQASPSASSAKMFDAGATTSSSSDWTADVDANPEDVAGPSRDWTADEDVNPEFLAELDRLEREHSTGRRKQQVSFRLISNLHANKVLQKRRSFAGTTVSPASLFCPLRPDNAAEVQFFWQLYEQLHPKSSRHFSAMAEQWNTITTMQLHTGNKDFQYIKLKRGFHLSKFWHSQGHKFLQRDASHIAALIQGCPASNAPPAETPLASAAAPSPRAQVSHPTPSLQQTICIHPFMLPDPLPSSLFRLPHSPP